jgi:sulfite exporter TauE/SafE
VLGGVIGAIGSAFQLSATASLILNIVIATVMLIMAINLLDLFHITKKFQLSMPKFLAGKAMKSVTEKEKSQSILTPIFTGAATFFLPCGFTQSMQIYTLSTGNFLQGGLTMLAFALGTLPILALISFTSFSIQKSPKAGIFFKTAGLIIIFFAIFNILNAFTAVGWIAPLWSASTTQQTSSASTTDNVEITDGKQIIEIVARGGYDPESTTAQAGTPTVITMITKGSFDCSTAVVIPEINYRANLPLSGETLIEIPPQEKGSVLEGFCAMGMYRFQIKFE